MVGRILSRIPMKTHPPLPPGPRGRGFAAPAPGGLGAIALAVGLSLLAGQAASAQVGVGDAFPALATAGLLSDSPPATEGKVVLVDFWASWCAPCKASFAAYGRLNAEFAPKGLVVVAVSVDQKPAAFDAFVKGHGPAFFVTRDRDQKLVGAVRVPTMPTSYLIDRQGRVRYMHAGFHGSETESAMRKEIESLLSDRAP
jgi:thiol-disulfide isomerase/thioredoxin